MSSATNLSGAASFASRTPARISFSASSAEPTLNSLAPKVFAVITSAPASA